MKQLILFFSILMFLISCSNEKNTIVKSVCNLITNPALIASTPENISDVLGSLAKLKTSDSGSTYHYFKLQKETEQIKRMSATYTTKRSDIKDGFVLEGFGIDLTCNSSITIEGFNKILTQKYNKIITKEVNGAICTIWPLNKNYETFLYQSTDNPCMIQILIQTKNHDEEDQ